MPECKKVHIPKGCEPFLMHDHRLSANSNRELACKQEVHGEIGQVPNRYYRSMCSLPSECSKAASSGCSLFSEV